METSLEEASEDTAAEAMLSAQRDNRRASNHRASASGRQDHAPEDAAFKRFDSIVDDWLVRLPICHLTCPTLPWSSFRLICLQPGAHCFVLSAYSPSPGMHYLQELLACSEVHVAGIRSEQAHGPTVNPIGVFQCCCPL